MSNKRRTKKQIRHICGDIAAECIVTRHLIPNADAEKLDEAVVSLASLQETALTRVNIVFDKAPRDFANPAEYRRARREYFKRAFNSLDEGFNKELVEIVKVMNAAVPRAKKD